MAGVFGLKKVYNRQRVDNWPESANYGYFGSGGFYPSSSTNEVERIDFFNETVSLPDAGTSFRSKLGTFSNSEYGYFCGGSKPPPFPTSRVSWVDRLDFSNEVTTSPLYLETVVTEVNGLSSPNYGYLGGGYTVITTDTISRTDFATETNSEPGLSLTSQRSNNTSVSTSDYGYFVGGYDGSSHSTIDRLDFSSETVAGPPVHGQTVQARQNSAGVFTSDYGYFCGGGPGSVPIDRIDLFNDTVSQPGNDLNQSRTSVRGVNSSFYGYFAGGSPPTSGLDTLNTIDRIDFSSETTSAVTDNLSRSKSNVGAVTGGKSINAKGFKKYRTDISGNPIAKSYGYYAGGNTPSTVATVRRIEFSNETVASPGNDLTQARRRVAVSFNNNYGYFAGGGPPSYKSIIDRLDFSNETMAGPPVHGLNLSGGREGAAGVLNSNYGYFGGGDGPPYLVTVDRLDFSNETISSLDNGLTQARRRLAAVSNYNYGYFGGGSTPSTVNTIDRIDFSTETIALPPVENKLQQSRHNLTAVSASDYGYFAGGGAGSAGPPYVNTIDKIDFSNETTSAAANNLTQGRGGLAGSYNSNYGYFAGGFSPPYRTTVDKIDFSNETTSPSANNLPQGVANFAAGVSN